ncbi:hypothetical protein HOH87_00125, partial [bacterium]|nr:hypothetical protein [bacterium]
MAHFTQTLSTLNKTAYNPSVTLSTNHPASVLTEDVQVDFADSAKQSNWTTALSNTIQNYIVTPAANTGKDLWNALNEASSHPVTALATSRTQRSAGSSYKNPLSIVGLTKTLLSGLAMLAQGVEGRGLTETTTNLTACEQEGINIRDGFISRANPLNGTFGVYRNGGVFSEENLHEYTDRLFNATQTIVSNFDSVNQTLGKHNIEIIFNGLEAQSRTDLIEAYHDIQTVLENALGSARNNTRLAFDTIIGTTQFRSELIGNRTKEDVTECKTTYAVTPESFCDRLEITSTYVDDVFDTAIFSWMNEWRDYSDDSIASALNLVKIEVYEQLILTIVANMTDTIDFAKNETLTQLQFPYDTIEDQNSHLERILGEMTDSLKEQFTLMVDHIVAIGNSYDSFIEGEAPYLGDYAKYACELKESSDKNIADAYKNGLQLGVGGA